MQISTDDYIIFRSGFFKINYTILFSWIVMLLLVGIAMILKVKMEKTPASNRNISFLQATIEIFLEQVTKLVRETNRARSEIILPLIGTLFLYVLASNLISLVPLCVSPTASLTTTVALALIVFTFTIFTGLREHGLGHFRKYMKPVFIMAPFNIMGDLSKIASLSIRLYGNVMSAFVIDSILSSIKLLSTGFPVVISLLGMVSGVIQAYIFSMLSLMFLSSDD
ncbi:MAG: F0F1 ATP synthase subunit A [Rickettsiales bacterium]|jgi:F-type H+-transporting ATPase subunit a|nr:F0F1 ATP synthase subunit A [Rickettsiales bacterium]